MAFWRQAVTTGIGGLGGMAGWKAAAILAPALGIAPAYCVVVGAFIFARGFYKESFAATEPGLRQRLERTANWAQYAFEYKWAVAQGEPVPQACAAMRKFLSPLYEYEVEAKLQHAADTLDKALLSSECPDVESLVPTLQAMLVGLQHTASLLTRADLIGSTARKAYAASEATIARDSRYWREAELRETIKTWYQDRFVAFEYN